MDRTSLISSTWHVETFATDHAIPSQGYILYRQLSPTSQAIPEIAFTGDSRFTVFTDPAHPDLLKANLLICEATYLEDTGRMAENAQQYGHTRLQQYAKHSELFQNVGALFLVHFSDRYSARSIVEKVYEGLPKELARRVYCSLTAKRAQNVEQSAYPPV